MKYIIFYFLFLFIFSSIHAQKEKVAIGILPFTSSVKTKADGTIPDIGAKSELLQQLYGIISSTFQKSKLFVIVERTRNDAIKTEQDFQKNIDFTGGISQIDETAFIGAKYVVVGNLSNVVKIQGAWGGDVKIGISYDIKILDITTSEVKAAEHFENEAINKTTDAAFNDALTATQTPLLNFLYANFKPEIIVLDIEEKADNAAKILVLNGGIEGLSKGSLIKITEEITYQHEGKNLIRKKEVGQAKIINIEGDNFATAEVNKNGIEILAKFAAGTKLKASPLQETNVDKAPISPTTKPKKEKKKQLDDYY